MLKAMATSQMSAWADFITSFVVFKVIDYIGAYGSEAAIAAACGAIAGGITNCTINYKWTFRGNHCPVTNVTVKYIMVWIGSFLFNTYGTEFLTDFCLNFSLFDSWGFSRDLRFSIARLSVSLIVTLGWNLPLQRKFVYRYVKFDSLLSHLISRPR